MSDEKVLAEGDHPKNLFIIGAVLVVCTGLIVMVVAVNEFYKFAVRDAIQEKQLSPENALKRAQRAKEQAVLGKYQWVDQNAGVVRIPMERAFELTVRDWASRPDTLPPAPAPVPAPAPAPPAKGN